MMSANANKWEHQVSAISVAKLPVGTRSPEYMSVKQKSEIKMLAPDW